jgi:pyruvate ferredoxin oxidoreductase gamma subunit
MEKVTEIRWHGRGGQGVVTAAKLLAESALEQDKYFQAMPEYGAERMGAPIQAFTRLSSEPISLHCNITNPNIVMVLDQTLLGVINVADGLTDDGVILVNTNCDPKKVRGDLKLTKGKVFTVNATQIALETIGKPIPNTPMLGALIKATGIISLDNVLEHLKKSFGKKFAQEIIDANINAVKRAYEEVVSE